MRTLLLVSLSACAASVPSSAPCASPAPDADWQVAGAAESGFDDERLCAALTFASETRDNLHAVLVERRGRLIGELYRPARDAPLADACSWFGPSVTFDAAAPHDLRSISKSVTALLVAVTQDRGVFPEQETFVADWFEGRGPEVTVGHLLSMSSGLEWHEWGVTGAFSDETALCSTGEVGAFVLSRRRVAEPGTRFNYSGGNTAVLAAMLQRATQTRLDALAATALFEPLGITSRSWVTGGAGDPLAHAGLRLTARELLKLGRLVNQGGVWRGTRVVSASRLEAMRRPLMSTDIDLFSLSGEPVSYGQHWWVGEAELLGQRHPWAQAVGNGGQRLVVLPSLDLSIVVLGGEYGNPEVQRTVSQLVHRLLAALER